MEAWTVSLLVRVLSAVILYRNYFNNSLFHVNVWLSSYLTEWLTISGLTVVFQLDWLQSEVIFHSPVKASIILCEGRGVGGHVRLSHPGPPMDGCQLSPPLSLHHLILIILPVPPVRESNSTGRWGKVTVILVTGHSYISPWSQYKSVVRVTVSLFQASLFTSGVSLENISAVTAP